MMKKKHATGRCRRRNLAHGQPNAPLNDAPRPRRWLTRSSGDQTRENPFFDRGNHKTKLNNFMKKTQKN